jgi:hypothetical protein
MKKNLLLFSLFAWCLAMSPMVGHCSAKPEAIDPCSLIAVEKVLSAFPVLQKEVKQQVGPTTVCNYLDKYGIPALIISVSQAGNHARDTLSMLGSGYVIEDIPNLGDDAAVAIQQANPTFGLHEGVAALHIKKGKISLNLSFTRINIPAKGPEIEKAKQLAAEMLKGSGLNS